MLWSSEQHFMIWPYHRRMKTYVRWEVVLTKFKHQGKLLFTYKTALLLWSFIYYTSSALRALQHILLGVLSALWILIFWNSPENERLVDLLLKLDRRYSYLSFKNEKTKYNHHSFWASGKMCIADVSSCNFLPLLITLGGNIFRFYDLIAFFTQCNSPPQLGINTAGKVLWKAKYTFFFKVVHLSV